MDGLEPASDLVAGLGPASCFVLLGARCRANAVSADVPLIHSMPRPTSLISEATPPASRALSTAATGAPSSTPEPERQPEPAAMRHSPSGGEMKFLIQTMSGQLDEASNALVKGKEREDEAQRATQRVREHMQLLHQAVQSAMDSTAPIDTASLGEKLAAVQRETDRVLEGKAIAERQAAVLQERNADLERQIVEIKTDRDRYKSAASKAAALAEGLAPGALASVARQAVDTLDEDGLRAEVSRLRAEVMRQKAQLEQARSIEEALEQLAQAETAAAAASAAAEASLAATAQLHRAASGGQGSAGQSFGRRRLAQYDR